VECGALWHLVLLLFGYDYTLHESGVEASVETNEQEGANNNARVWQLDSLRPVTLSDPLDILVR
jgi:hypothetical protein